MFLKALYFFSLSKFLLLLPARDVNTVKNAFFFFALLLNGLYLLTDFFFLSISAYTGFVLFHFKSLQLCIELDNKISWGE